MEPYSSPSIAAQVAKISTEIKAHGSSTVGCEELGLLCDDGVHSSAEKKTGLEQIAEWEGWVYETLPNGNTRFSSLKARPHLRP